MGIIADTFRLLPDTKLGEGTFAISAWGKNADKISTGLEYLIDNGGKALLLGVDIYSLTSMHYVENYMPKEISNIFKSPEMDDIYPPDEWLIENGAPPVQPWYTIQDMAYERNLIKDGKIGDCKCMFFDIGTTLVDETEAYNHRIRDEIAGTDISFEHFSEKILFFAKQGLKGDLEAIKYFGLSKAPWHKEDEVLYSDSEDVLKYLCEKGYKVGIIANQSLGTAERLEKWGILKYINVVASSAEMGVVKPDRKIFEED